MAEERNPWNWRGSLGLPSTPDLNPFGRMPQPSLGPSPASQPSMAPLDVNVRTACGDSPSMFDEDLGPLGSTWNAHAAAARVQRVQNAAPSPAKQEHPSKPATDLSSNGA
jgi:hypothetical protein